MNAIRFTQILLIFTVGMYGSSLYAEIYQWKDQHGQIHFGDNKPQHQKAEKLNLKINTYSTVSYDSLTPQQKTSTSSSQVELYSTDWCKYCDKAKAYFNKNNIAYTEYNIEKNDEARRRYQKLGAKGVPVIIIGNRRMNGFSVSGFNRLYKQ